MTDSPYTMMGLVNDVIPRVGNLPKSQGITIFGAANSIQSLLFKKLLDRKSDLVASGNLALNIAAMGYTATLPLDFYSLAEKPRSQDLLTDWMAGTVVSYNNVTGALVVNVTQASGSDTLSSWNIALAATPGNPSQVVGSSSQSLTVAIGQISFVASPNMGLTVGQYIYILPTSLPAINVDLSPLTHLLEPSYLDDDNEPYHDATWWEWYGIYGNTVEPPCIRPRRYKIIGTTMYVRPIVIVNVLITGKYFQKVSTLAQPTDVIPWNGFFDEIFREGVVRIIQKGIAIPSADTDFMIFLYREFDSVQNSRVHLIPREGRMKRSTWM